MTSALLALLLAFSSVDQVVDALARRVDIRGVALSPDGRRVAWVQGPTTDPKVAALYVDGKPVTLCRSRCNERDPAWSPDSRRLAFLSDGAVRGQSDLYVWDGSAARRLTHNKGALSSPRFSPDGKQLAFLWLEGEGAEGPMGPAARDSGVVQEVVHEQRIAVVNPAALAQRARLVSPADLYVYEFDWSPSNRSWAAIAAKGSGDDNWWIAQLYLLENAEARVLLKPKTQLACPRFSPDGHSVAVIQGLMSDEDLSGGDIYLVPTDGGEAKNLTEGRKSSPSSLAWAGGKLFFAEWTDGDSALATLSPSGEVATLWRGSEHLGTTPYSVTFSLSADGAAAAVVKQSISRAPEVFAGPIGTWTQRTHLNGHVSVFSGEARKLHVHVDAFDEQAWLIPPAHLEAGHKYPLVVVVHGGPAWESASRFDRLWQLLSSQGFFVLAPNPRGSFGQGEAFTAGNVRDFGGGDLRDILAAVEAAVAAAPIDKDRVGLYGWSYGGYMGMWAATQTRRFKAIVAGAGIANWQSYYGENRIDQWMLPYFGASVYDDPAIYAKASPINFIKQVKTPTLLLQGERDAEVPAPQSYEFWHALKTLGVEVQLVIYPDEGHVPRLAKNTRDVDHRIVGWFEKHL